MTLKNKDLNVVILAAGKGSRFKSKTPKILIKIKSKTLIEHSISLAKKINPKNIYLILNPKLSFLEKKLNCKFFYQNRPLGTGHAIKLFLKKHNNLNKLLILNADTPFINLNAANKIIEKLNLFDLVLSGFITKKNKSYGLIKRNKENKVTKIIEYKNANKKDKEINLCNSGMMGISKKNYKNIFKIKKDKTTKEYYLTDIAKLTYENGLNTKIVLVKNNSLSKGINTINDYKSTKIFFSA